MSGVLHPQQCMGIALGNEDLNVDPKLRRVSPPALVTGKSQPASVDVNNLTGKTTPDRLELTLIWAGQKS